MKYLAVLALAGVFGLSSAQTLFYGGDKDGRNGLVSGRNMVSGGEAESYDNFNLGTASNVTGIFGNFYMVQGVTVTQAYYEIRQGMADNNGGTLITSGVVAASQVDTGQSDFGLEIFKVTANASFALAAGNDYFVTLAPYGNGSSSLYLATTSGTNGVGGPLADGRALFNAISVYGNASGHNFEDAQYEFGSGTWDFSIGLNGSPVPEPASMAALGIGALALIRRRRAK